MYRFQGLPNIFLLLQFFFPSRQKEFEKVLIPHGITIIYRIKIELRGRFLVFETGTYCVVQVGLELTV